MIAVHHVSARRPLPFSTENERTMQERKAGARHARKNALVILAIFAVVVTLACIHSAHVLAAHAPEGMPANARWVLTGQDRISGDKQGIWIACWKSTVKPVDHCRITNEVGDAEFDGDMMPLANYAPAVEDKDLKLAAVRTDELWVRGVNSEMPIPVLPLQDGTQLVPVSERKGLETRVAQGEWNDGMEPAQPPVVRKSGFAY